MDDSDGSRSVYMEKNLNLKVDILILKKVFTWCFVGFLEAKTKSNGGIMFYGKFYIGYVVFFFFYS